MLFFQIDNAQMVQGCWYHLSVFTNHKFGYHFEEGITGGNDDRG